MRIRNLVYVVAALFLVAACESAPTETSSASGSGSAQSASSGGGTSASGGARGGASAQPSITPGSEEDFVRNVGDRVFFDFDKSNIRSDQRATLQRQAAWLNRYPQVTVTIEGHADERGTREYNLALGERRANSARDFLVALGINPNRLRVISFGKERPVALGHNEEAWAQNRRAVSVIAGAPGS